MQWLHTAFFVRVFRPLVLLGVLPLPALPALGTGCPQLPPGVVTWCLHQDFLGRGTSWEGGLPGEGARGPGLTALSASPAVDMAGGAAEGAAG